MASKFFFFPITTFQDFKTLHFAQAPKDHLRLGQRFVNMYIKESWPELFYCEDIGLSLDIINEWLMRHHYVDQLPQPLRGRPFGICNRSSCQNFPATWYNGATRAYYCQPCAFAINDANADMIGQGWTPLSRIGE